MNNPVVRGPLRVALAVVAAVGVGVSCGGSTSLDGAAPPAYGVAPNLAGTPTMLFPVQAVSGGVGRTEVDRELQFAVSEAGADWLFPEDLAALIARSPNLDVPLEQLPVGVFLQAEVERVGDPLFGYLRRLNAVTEARVAVIPVLAAPVVDAESDTERWEIRTAVVDAQRGFVIWFGSTESTAVAGGPPPIAGVAQRLVQRFIPAR